VKKNKKIFIGTQEIAGYYHNLWIGIKSLGFDCDYVTYSDDIFGSGSNIRTSILLKSIAWLSRCRRGKNNRTFIFFRAVITLLIEALCLIYFFIALFRYDVFIFGYGYTLLRWNLDLPVLRLFGKKVLVNMAHGSELRPPFIDGSYQTQDGLQPQSKILKRLALRHKRRIKFFEITVDLVIGAPFSSTQYSSQKLINIYALGIPCYSNLDVADSPQYRFGNNHPVMMKDDGTPVRILHSPSHSAVKGSVLIREAVERLKSSGYNIDFIEIKGRPNSEVIKEIQLCDFIVDQIYSDTPMAGFATEAACFGRPAVVGGYRFEYLKKFIPPNMWPPSKICHPDDLEDSIKELIVNVDLRRRLGAKAYEFVHTQWPAVKVAEKYMRLIHGDIPQEWWLEPQSVAYFHGCGQSEKKTKDNVRSMVASYGVQSLQLSHRPELEKAFLEFADIEQK